MSDRKPLNADRVVEKIGIILNKDHEDVKAHKIADPGIERMGSKIILPNEPGPMPILEAIGALLRYMEDEETLMSVVETIDCFPMDGAIAFNEAMRQIYGWASPTPVMTWWGPIPPKLLTIKTGPKKEDVVQVPWGEFTIPGIENQISIQAGPGEDMPQFRISGHVRKRERYVLLQLAERTREIIAQSSIYKGKALHLQPDDEGNLNLNEAPKFLDLASRVDLILNNIEMDQIQAALWTPIQFTDDCIRHQIPLKRGILLEGTYGIGKTLTARETARICVENGWTFVMLDDVRALEDALKFARRYSPAVVFAEDIDRIIEERTEEGNDLLNTIDGVLSKDAKVITVLTTNHVEKINPAMLRPGRFDAVVRMKPPEPQAVERLIRLYGRGLIPATQGLQEIGEKLAGHIPATIREVVERAKLGMIGAQQDTITEHALIVSAETMQGHLELLKPVEKPQTPAERLGETLGEVIRQANGLDKLENQVERIDRTVGMIAGM